MGFGAGLESKENYALTSIRSPPTIQPIQSRYEDCAILVLPYRLYTRKINTDFDTRKVSRIVFSNV